MAASLVVSVVVPCLRWDADLKRCVEAIRGQELPQSTRLEVVIAIAEQPDDAVLARMGDEVRVVANESGRIPTGLNLAIQASTGEIVCRVDSRSVIAADYLRRVIDDLRDPTIGCVGGAQLVIDEGFFGAAYHVAFNSPLCGPSTYRFGRTSCDVDSAYLGAWRREVLDEVGGFDERLARNQDNELADRVRAAGYRVRYDANLVVGYRLARDLPGALRHHHEFGYWRRHQDDLGQDGLSSRHRAALTLVGGSGLLGLAGVVHPRTRSAMVIAGVATYVGLAAVAERTSREMRRARPDLRPDRVSPGAVLASPALGVLLDLAWGAGLLSARRDRRSRSRESAVSETPNVLSEATPTASIRQLTVADLPQVARVHARAFPDRAMTRLGESIVIEYYRWLLVGPHESKPVGIFVDDQLVAYLVSGRFDRALGGFLDRNRARVLTAALRHPGVLGAPEFREQVKTAASLLVRGRPPGDDQRCVEVPPGDSWGILSIAVDPTSRRLGFGQRLLSHAESEAREVEASFLRLTVDPENTGAVAFYEADGWTKAGVGREAWSGTMIRPL